MSKAFVRESDEDRGVADLLYSFFIANAELANASLARGRSATTLDRVPPADRLYRRPPCPGALARAVRSSRPYMILLSPPVHRVRAETKASSCSLAISISDIAFPIAVDRVVIEA